MESRMGLDEKVNTDNILGRKETAKKEWVSR